MGRPLLVKNMALMDVVLVKMVVLLQASQGKFFPFFPPKSLIFNLFHLTIYLSLTCCFISIREGLDLVKEAIGRTGYSEKLKIAIDVDATEFCIGDLLIFFCN